MTTNINNLINEIETLIYESKMANARSMAARETISMRKLQESDQRFEFLNIMAHEAVNANLATRKASNKLQCLCGMFGISYEPTRDTKMVEENLDYVKRMWKVMCDSAIEHGFTIK